VLATNLQLLESGEPTGISQLDCGGRGRHGARAAASSGEAIQIHMAQYDDDDSDSSDMAMVTECEGPGAMSDGCGSPYSLTQGWEEVEEYIGFGEQGDTTRRLRCWIGAQHFLSRGGSLATLDGYIVG
jgi:hypothetical protein